MKHPEEDGIHGQSYLMSECPRTRPWGFGVVDAPRFPVFGTTTHTWEGLVSNTISLAINRLTRACAGNTPNVTTEVQKEFSQLECHQLRRCK